MKIIGGEGGPMGGIQVSGCLRTTMIHCTGTFVFSRFPARLAMPLGAGVKYLVLLNIVKEEHIN